MSGAFTILVASDLSEEGGYAFEQAARLAQRIADASLHFVHITKDASTEDQVKRLASQLELYVSEKAASMGGLDGMRVGVHVRGGHPAREIAQLAADIDAALLVVGSPRHPRLRALGTGDVGQTLLAHAPCPVIFAGPRPDDPAMHGAAIEPPCPDCVATRARTNGREWWCARHAAEGGALRGHMYSYQRELPFAVHDSSVVPTGTRF